MLTLHIRVGRVGGVSGFLLVYLLDKEEVVPFEYNRSYTGGLISIRLRLERVRMTSALLFSGAVEPGFRPLFEYNLS